jgi:hypothetical protein
MRIIDKLPNQFKGMGRGSKLLIKSSRGFNDKGFSPIMWGTAHVEDIN